MIITSYGRYIWIHIILIVFLWTFLLLSCSSNNPASPDTVSELQSQHTVQSNHTLWGIYTIGLDLEQMKVISEPMPLRSVEWHYNMTHFLQPPHCDDCFAIEIIDFNLAQKYIVADVTIKNPSNLDAYDVRGIFMHAQPGWDVTNADAYTDLWDIGTSTGINPFRAFAKTVPYRTFGPQSEHSETYEITFPDEAQFLQIQYAIDVSWPDNCEEPYSFSNIDVSSTVDELNGGQVNISFNAHDWQGGGIEGYIDLSVFGLGDEESLNFSPPNILTGVFDVSGEQTVGTYRVPIWILGGNQQALWRYVDIEVFPYSGPQYPIWDDTVGIVSTYPGDSDVVVHYGTATDPQGDDPVKYNIYYIDETETGENNPFDGNGNVKLTDVGDSPYTVESLTNNHIYHFGVRAEDSADPPNEEKNTETLFASPQVEIDWLLEEVTPDHILNIWPRDICIFNDKAFIADYDQGLAVLDISDPSHPVQLEISEDLFGQYDKVYQIEIIDNLMYVICTEGSNTVFKIFNITELENITETASTALPHYEENLTEMKIRNGYAFSSSYWSGVTVFDIDPPEDLIMVNNIDTDVNYIPLFAFYDNYFIHSAEKAGMQGFMVRAIDPIDEMPEVEFVQTLDYCGSGSGLVAVYEGYIYSACGNGNAIGIYDLDPVNGTEKLNEFSVDNPFWITCEDGHLILCDDIGIHSYNLADPANPVEVNLLNPFENLNHTGEIDFIKYTFQYGGDVSVINLKGLHFIITSDLASMEFSIQSWFTRALDMVMGNGYVYVSDGWSIWTYDVDPYQDAHLEHIYAVDGLLLGWNLLLQENILYVVGNYGLHIFDVTNPANLSLLGLVTLEGNDIAVHDGLAYIVGESGFNVVDVEPPESASVLNNFTDFEGISVAYNDGYCYIGTGSSSMLVIDVNPVEEMEIVNTINPPDSGLGAVSDIAIQNNLLACGNSWLPLYYLTDPEDPQFISYIYGSSCNGYPSVFYFHGDYLICANSASNLAIADINPPEIASYIKCIDSDTAWSTFLAVDGNFAYFALGLHIVRLY